MTEQNSEATAEESLTNDSASAEDVADTPGATEGGTQESVTEIITDPVAELTADLQRLQAEYANYRKRVERDRELVRDQVVTSTLAELLPVLDDIGRARSHNELEGAFKSVGESLESTVSRLGLKSFGEPGDAFDPERHEAIAHEINDDLTVATCVAVFQPGYEFAGRIVRAAMVKVEEPSSPSGQ